MIMQFGIIGYPLTHSFSPAYFTEKFEREQIMAVYEKFELKDITEFPSLLESHPNLHGLNVTIPYKKAIIPYLNTLSEEAEAIGAVNCIAICDRKLKGYNTDAMGFERSLSPLLKPVHRKALILGTGGSSLAVRYVLQKLGIEWLNVSRTASEDIIRYEDLNETILKGHLLIINTTPLGMFPHTEACPDIPYSFLTEQHLLYDLIYNPLETKFLALGRSLGTAVKNGLEMLHLQAEASWEIWSSKS